ncbi:fumarylacetoacetate hydrolase family protein [Microbacterium terregens]|uniref:Fumarylacetoacetate hydrolase family protein n=1 Tax=Microbacterium terregens TaxID=69363 RepID=A0ABV5SYY5_9MICO
MRLVRVEECSPGVADGKTRFGMLNVGDDLTVLGAEIDFAAALALLMGGEGTEHIGEKVSSDRWAERWRLLAPAPSPASLRDCVGFFQHIRNTRASRGDLAPLLPVWRERPGFYFANPQSLRSATDNIAIPAGSEAFDFELEIAAVIGTGGRDMTALEAGQSIAGYVMFCDWSARDLQAEERQMQIGLGKGKDSATSLGPWILSATAADAIRVPDGLDIPVSASVNGDLVTDPRARYRGMDWTFEEIIAYASMGADLVAGDIIAVGTVPTGCLLEQAANPDFRGWLTPGDEVRLTAGPLGEIASAITAGAPVANWRRE